MWPALASELNQAYVSNNADSLMTDYINLTGYDPSNGTFKNYDGYSTTSAVLCKDFRVPYSLNNKWDWLNVVSNWRAQYPLGAARATFGAKFCIKWPAQSDPLLPKYPEPIQNANPTVLIVSNTFDPVTPPKSAKSESRYLTNLNVTNQVLTWKGSGHIAYIENTPADGCVDQSIDNFFITGDFPNTNTCDDDINPFLQGNNMQQQNLRKLMKIF
ncbi:MAG: alpha/beta hydrolase [Gammaproteobacteria bacterium]|nr:alpha/beta hydrolase [Gammaproteobacteria bacterium]